ncbi:phosphatase PAP2 family protein [Modestobacter sp. NPDC049651]|uniref:phosphatase PAP2 family protein n=1 Tax=unclassified Modestobacter TaxID=2643866 RepID=UPI0033DD93C3
MLLVADAVPALPRLWPRRRRTVLAGLLGSALVALLVAVVGGGRVVLVDEAVYRWAPWQRWPALRPFLDWWVVLGQRAVCLAVAAVWLGLRAWRERDLRPLLLLLLATLLTNVAVGALKTAVGRLGPLQLGAGAALPGAGDVFAAGGTIFPSGHTANAVVTWGLLAVLARRWRRTAAVLATVLAVSVGLTTVYLGTHWLSDVLAGWCAGGLVLLAVPPSARWCRDAGARLGRAARPPGPRRATVPRGAPVRRIRRIRLPGRVRYSASGRREHGGPPIGRTRTR